jgi:hypothetical protein
MVVSISHLVTKEESASKQASKTRHPHETEPGADQPAGHVAESASAPEAGTGGGGMGHQEDRVDFRDVLVA